MSKRIESLTVANFRGAIRPITFNFQSDQSIVLIFGENGTGKSTIADALDFLCNSDFGSLKLRSGTTPKAHIVAAEGKASDLLVEMRYAGQAWRATLQNGKPATDPAKPPRAFVLRRADITRIMEATDSDRYKSLKDFITVPLIESAVTSLRTACKDINAEVEFAVTQRVTAESTLEKIWLAEGKLGSSAVAWARTAVKDSVTNLQEQISADNRLLQIIVTAVTAVRTLKEAKTSVEQLQNTHNTLEEELRLSVKNDVNADILDTLNAAQAYLKQHPESNACPVCAKPETPHNLLEKVELQLAVLQHSQSLHVKLKKSSIAIEQSKLELSSSYKAWRTAYQKLADSLNMHPHPLFTMVSMASAALPDDKPLFASLTEAKQIQIPLEERIEQMNTLIAQHNLLKTHLAIIDELVESTKEKYTLAQRLQAMLVVVEAERKEYVENIVGTISSTVAALYDRIHPGESIGEPTFGLKPKVAGSVTMKAKFGNRADVPPGAYYSEAHLDTLGLCVYLALAKQTGNALVVLDDVLMSIDDPHLDRVIELINDEAPSFGHVIITTHSRAWFDRMRSGQGMRAELIELYGWNLAHGMHYNKAPLLVDELREAVNAIKLDRQMVAARAGILLEQLLDWLALRYGTKVARKHTPHYTLGELADSFDSKLKPQLRIEQTDEHGLTISTLALHTLIQQATKDISIRNQVGAHFNPSANSISDVLVKQFGRNVVGLAEALLCKHCRQLPNKNKSGSYWQCGGNCGRIRLYPLKMP